MPLDERKKRDRYLRERFEKMGVGGLGPKEALELLIGYDKTCPDPYAAACLLLEEFKDIETVLNSSYSSLAGVKGITEETARLISGAASINELADSESGFTRIMTCNDAESFFLDVFCFETVESFKIACLDSTFQVLHLFDMGEGSTFGVSTDMKTISEKLTQWGCKKCIIAHNHPGGSCMPSSQDISSTHKLSEYLSERGIELLDHIIVGKEGARSLFADRDICTDRLGRVGRPHESEF